MTFVLPRDQFAVDAAVAGAVDRFGLYAVLRALARHLVVRPRRQPHATVDDLDDRLRRDVGLPPRTEARLHRLDRPLPWLL